MKKLYRLEGLVEEWFWANVDVDARHHKMLPSLIALVVQEHEYQIKQAYKRGYFTGINKLFPLADELP
jgi:hypothetical protein